MSAALDRFFDHYYRHRPVNATFTGVHEFDHCLPDWRSSRLSAFDDEMRDIIRDLDAAHPLPTSDAALRVDPDALDAELARSFLEIQIAENASGHGVRGNPSLWIGEAVFGVIALMIRDFAPIDDRMLAAIARLNEIPQFLQTSSATIGDHGVPSAWLAKARRECIGGATLCDNIDLWIDATAHDVTLDNSLREAARCASASFRAFERALAEYAVDDSRLACGAEMYDLLLARGHQTRRSRRDLLVEAHERLREERARLDEMARDAAGSWPEAQAQMAADHPSQREYLATFERVWNECHDCAAAAKVVTWPDWPIRYRPFPSFTAAAAPSLYYLYYRSPAPFDPYTTYDYVVPPLPADGVESFLRTWNDATIKLNHVVHHGAVGHHVQNWHAYHRATSRIGQIAAVDCANRIGMFGGGTMAEGWACYATRLMEELSFLSPLEKVSEQHSRVRFLARAIVDIELHQGTMTFDEAVGFYIDRALLSAEAARAEVVKNSMFPCTALMYWLGTQTILELRNAARDRPLKEFHDELLAFGSIPVPLIARMMSASTNG